MIRIDEDVLPILWLSAEESEKPLRTPEFLRREYRVEAVAGHSLARRATPENPILAHAYTYPYEIENLGSLPKGSVRLLLESDETHRPDLLDSILKAPAIAELLRNYPYGSMGLSQIIDSFQAGTVELVQSPVRLWPGAARAMTAGAVMARRKARHSRLLEVRGLRVFGLPLGYTDEFVNGLKMLAATSGWRPLGVDESLITYLREHQGALEDLKSQPLSFVGQRGKFQRRSAIRAASRAGYRIGPIRQQFAAGGIDPNTAAVEYVSSLASSRFALCPPGNYSGDSFRLTEAVLLRCVPVESTNVMSEPDRGVSVWVGAGAVRGRSWRSALAKLEEVSPDQAVELADIAGRAYGAAIEQARRNLRGGASPLA